MLKHHHPLANLLSANISSAQCILFALVQADNVALLSVGCNLVLRSDDLNKMTHFWCTSTQLFCGVVQCVVSSFEIILMRKRELVALI